MLSPRSSAFLRRSNSIRTLSSVSNLKLSNTVGTTVPNKVRIVEVGPRDGLQNEKSIVTSAAKLALIDSLYGAGLRSIEAGAFVSPKWVPQMADTEEIFKNLSSRQAKGDFSQATFSALTPNLQGLEKALALGVKEVAVFGAASEAFSQKNINCSIEESLNRFKAVTDLARAKDVKVRGYVSCVLGCPYEGAVKPEKVVYVAQRLLEMGCYEISLGDTIGTGAAGTTHKLLDAVLKSVPTEKVAVHFHDTYGQALSNILVSLSYGINVIDSSVSGLGGCPYAKGASGNVATEDVVYMLNSMGIETGVDLNKLIEAGKVIDSGMNPTRTTQSKVHAAISKK